MPNKRLSKPIGDLLEYEPAATGSTNTQARAVQLNRESP